MSGDLSKSKFPLDLEGTQIYHCRPIDNKKVFVQNFRSFAAVIHAGMTICRDSHVA